MKMLAVMGAYLFAALMAAAPALAAGPHVPAGVTQNCLIDLHLHIDGSISRENAKRLAAMQGLPVPADAELDRLMRAPDDCRDLNDYLKCFDYQLTLLQSAEALEECTRALLVELRDQGLIYAELRYAPQLHTQKGMTQEQAVEAAIRGLRRAPIPASLILCCMRGEGEQNREANLETVRLAKKYIPMKTGVAAIDLAGAEALYKTSSFDYIFAEAAMAGIPFTIHAGEADGPSSVRAALRFGARRIGHGERSGEDEALLKTLAEKKIALEMCPTSNLNTRVVSNLLDYPADRYIKAGIPVTINTDNMTVSNTTTRRELRIIAEAMGWDDAVIKRLLLNSVEASCADAALKTKLRSKIEAAFAKR